jgi:tRNA (guanine37-N1)-methyltransferase
VDDTPFGGGGGMILRAEPLFAVVEDLRVRRTAEASAAKGTDAGPDRTFLLCPQGRRLDQAFVRELAGQGGRLILLCGRYEGVDERVREHLADGAISIGDYVLSGGEFPALVLVEAVTRLLPGALGRADSALCDSFTENRLDFPHYTRPAEFRGWKAPEVLLSGDHEAVAAWRREKALERTELRRPDLLTFENKQTAPEGAGSKR